MRADTWEFLHKAILDFFAAEYMVDSTRDISESLLRLAGEQHETRAIRYVCGLSSNASSILTNFLKWREGQKPAHAFQYLVDALVETRNVEKEILKRVVEEFVRVAAVRLDDAEAEVLTDSYTSPWAAKFLCKNHEPVRSVVRAVYRTRESTCAELLLYALQSSTDARLVHLKDLLESDGELKEGKSEHHEDGYLVRFRMAPSRWTNPQGDRLDEEPEGIA